MSGDWVAWAACLPLFFKGGQAAHATPPTLHLRSRKRRPVGAFWGPGGTAIDRSAERALGLLSGRGLRGLPRGGRDARADPLLNVRLQDAERLLVTL